MGMEKSKEKTFMWILFETFWDLQLQTIVPVPITIFSEHDFTCLKKKNTAFVKDFITY